jgi:hypothetical protein
VILSSSTNEEVSLFRMMHGKHKLKEINGIEVTSNK